MKNGKAPTREQKKIMRAHGLVPENWLVVKNLPDTLEVVSRTALKKIGRKPRTKTIYLEASAWADKLQKEDGAGYEFLKVLCLCRKPKETGCLQHLYLLKDAWNSM